MKILVDRITETPLSLAFEATPDWWAATCGRDVELAEALASPAACELSVHRMGDDLYLEGVLSGDLALSCGRCLSRYRAPIRERFRLVLEPAGSRVPADPEGAESLASEGLYLSDELESGWFRGSEIQLDRFLRELIAVDLPVQPVCREDCRGLCPRCGVDRNDRTCECVEERRASPFAVLEKLRARPSAGSGPGGSSE